VALLKTRSWHNKVVVGGPFDSKVLKQYNCWWGPFESKVLTHYNCCWGLFESMEFYIIIAVGDHFESKVLTHYSCCWVPFASTVLTHYSFFKTSSMNWKSRVLTHFSGCWRPFESRLPSNYSCCWRPLWKQSTRILQFLYGDPLKAEYLYIKSQSLCNMCFHGLLGRQNSRAVPGSLHSCYATANIAFHNSCVYLLLSTLFTSLHKEWSS